MEIMQSNLPQSLNIGCGNRRSYIKPPIPPKPKVIPKPKSIPSQTLVNSKLLKSKSSKEDSRSKVVENTINLHDESSISSSSDVMQESKIVWQPSATLHCTDKHPPKVVLHYADSNQSRSMIESNSSGENETLQTYPVDDVCSRIMENTLEECLGLSSKSSSDSSISLEDSDSDEFHPSNEGDCRTLTSSVDFSPSPTRELSIDCVDDANVMSNNISNDNEASKFSKKAFLVAREIKTSEESFVAILKLLNEEFRTFLLNKGCVATSTTQLNEKNQRCDAIPERDLDEILKYLPNLQSLNEEILADFEIRIREWESHKKIADIIVRKGPFLKLYANYIRELEYHTNLLHESATRYSFFGECLAEFQQSERSRFLPVGKHMLTPMQRITKYKELMKQYLKYLKEDDEDYEDAVQALGIVKGVAEHANEAIRELENSARLLCLQERLNGISNADGGTPGGKGNLQHVLVEPGRKLLKEGQIMKLCRRGVRVAYLILLSDSLLYTIQELHGAKNCPLRLRYKMPLEGMRVETPVSEDFQNEFTVISTSRSFTIRASCAKERDSWMSCLRGAIEANAIRRVSFDKVKTLEFEMLDVNALGKQAPAWIPDNRVTMCQVCTSEFSLTFRRHHCRACGKVVCRHCSSNRAPLAYLDNQSERVCDNCFEELQKALLGIEQKEDEISDEDQKERFRKSLRIIKGRFKSGVKDTTRRSRLKKPERLLEVCGGDLESQICGYLRHYSRRTWRHSWFVLKDKVLYEYRAPEDVCALNSLPILGYSVSTEFQSVDIFDGMDSSNAFQLLHSNQPPLVFCSESSELADKWRTVMEREVDL